MIRYKNTSYNKLLGLIDTENKNWLKRAKKRTESFRQLKKYSESSNMWREIVTVYMGIQHNKCAFCERKLEGPKTGGKREFDIEHFRPKSSVKSWPPKSFIKEFKLPKDFPKSSGAKNGYYLLPYHPYNYTVACKPCNSSMKSNYFPINGKRQITGDDPRKMNNEKAYLVYPLGTFDENPEKIIKYEGVVAVPATSKGRIYERARVTILFFRLNDRDEHFSERAEKISHLFFVLEAFHNPGTPSKRTLAEKAIEHLISAKSSHTNCTRSFYHLYNKDRQLAEKIAAGSAEFLRTGS